MTSNQLLLFAILAAAVILFAWGRWRHDIVALGALLAAVLTGLVPGTEAFSGLGHPAVVTVACVLVLSHGLQATGAVDMAARRLLPAEAQPLAMIAILTGIAALLSGFMNNVGALALLMPVALQAAKRLDLPPGRLLMPLAFGSILGGMTTLIGTPPNLIVSGYRQEALGEPFGMFAFTPVGLGVALAGVAFVSVVGWRLVPERHRADAEGFDAGAYITEAEVPEGAKAVGMTVRAAEEAGRAASLQILGIIRRDVRLRAPARQTRLRAGDVLVLEAEPQELPGALSALGLELDVPKGDAKQDGEAADRDHSEDDVVLTELVVTPGARLIGRSARDVRLRPGYQINLLALSRQGRRSIGRLRTTRLTAGDVLLVHGPAEAIGEFAGDYGCLPLAHRPLRIPDDRRMRLAIAIMGASVLGTASGLVAAPVAFAAGVLAAMVTRVVPPDDAYAAVDWPVVVLLASLLPIADAMLSTGAADLVAARLVRDLAGGAPVAALVLLLVVTMTLSDVMNNAATVAVMAPIALGAADTLGVDPDAFLMAVAVGGSCAFLTPVGHQNNTLILGPGGFRFGDYWRLGLPLEILVVAAAVPLILLVWGL